MKVDILFCVRNRREYTEEALKQLEKNTNWDLVNNTLFWDDGSVDGTQKLSPYPMPRTTPTTIGSPVAIMNAFLQLKSGSPWFAKIDNDTIVPPGWLDACVAIADTDNADLIGIEARYCKHPPMKAGDTSIVQYRATDHIGGIGLFRRSVFDQYPLILPNDAARAYYKSTGQDPRYYGFTEWQWLHPDVRKVWIDPPLPVFLLDHLPLEPWRGLGREYVRRGWQRESWGEYDSVKDKGLWAWWLNNQHAYKAHSLLV